MIACFMCGLQFTRLMPIYAMSNTHYVTHLYKTVSTAFAPNYLL